MNRRLVQLIGIAVALAAGFAGYAIVVGLPFMGTSVQARPLTMPAVPHMLYLAPEGSQRGLVNRDIMLARGVTPVYTWPSARSAARNRPLDAMLIDTSSFDTMSDSDLDWLRAQFRDGVVIVALGVNDDRFAQILGLETLRAPAEASPAVDPIGPTGYRLVMRQVLGQPDDVETLERSNWIGRILRGEDGGTVPIKNPLRTSFHSSRGKLDSVEELDLLFSRITSAIQGAYQTRAEFRQSLNDLREER